MKKFNEYVAVKGTLIFGSMWTTYIFFCYGFLPIMFPKHMDTFLYWSNTVQLWSLPLLMVGQVVMGRASEERNNQMYDMIKEELTLVKEELALAKEERQELTELVKYLHEKLDNGGK